MTDLDALYREHAHDLRRFAYRRVPDPDTAADLVHEAFAKYAAAISDGTHRPVNHPRFFLQRTITNLAIDRARQRDRRGCHLALDELGDELADSAGLPEMRVDQLKHVAVLLASLEALPRRERQALVRNRMDGMTHTQLAREFDVSPSMVSKYIMNAIDRLKRVLPSVAV